MENGSELLANCEFVAFDIETTGMSARNDRIVEIGAVRFRADGSEIAAFQRLIHPGRAIPYAVTRIHGITDQMVREAPREAVILPEFLQFLGETGRTILMAHNASFDVSFLEAAIRRAKLEQPEHDVLDTVIFARRRYVGLPSYSLGSLTRSLGIVNARAHRGLSDAVALKELFRRLIERPPAMATLAELKGHCSARNRFQNVRRRESGGRGYSRGFSSGSYGTSALGAAELVMPAFLQGGEPRGGVGENPAWQSILEEAIAGGRPVAMLYEGGRAAGTSRRVFPRRVMRSGEMLYLVAFCERDGIEKHFRFDRIQQLEAVGHPAVEERGGP